MRIKHFVNKLRGCFCSIGLSLMIGLPITALAVTVEIHSPPNGAVIENDHTLVTGIASALGSGGQGIDVMLVLDDSGSLQDTDPTRERFEATQQLLSSFGPNANVHIGLVFFSSAASLAVSLQSVSTASSPINGAILNHQMPDGDTAIGDGIQSAVNELNAKGRANTSKVILVFTDGMENAGSITAEVAAQTAFNQGYTVHVIGLFPAVQPVANPFFQPIDPQAGQDAAQRIAQAGGGRLFLATQASQLIPLFRNANLVDIASVAVTNVTTGAAAGGVSLSTGNFTGPIDLMVGENVLQAVATDTNGATASASVTVTRPPQCPGDISCPCPNELRDDCPTAKDRPQLIMAGFDPMLIDFGQAEISFKVMAVVREGSAAIRQVILKNNREAISAFSTNMTLEGQLPNNDKVYSLKYVMDREQAFSLKGRPLPNLFGSGVEEYHVTIIDEAQKMHAFPDLVIGSNPEVQRTRGVTQTNPYTKPGIYRYRPQVIMVGFDPMLLDYSDDHFKITAVVRPGNTLIQNVVVKNKTNLKLAMNLEGEFGNGDLVYSTEYSFMRGSLPEGALRDLFGDEHPVMEYVVEVIDQAQQKHAFPELFICPPPGCPEYKP